MIVCSCGFANTDAALSCIACGAPLSNNEAPITCDTTTAAASEHCGEPSVGHGPLVLEDVRSGHRIVVTAPGGILGRAGDFDPDAFGPQVSGVHLVAQCDETGAWTLEFVGRNATSVNAGSQWVPLPLGVPYPVFGGELLKMADMLFRLQMEAAPTEGPYDDACMQEPQDEGTMPETTSERWVITCPACGATFDVTGPEERMGECPSCVDFMDRRRIALATPRRI